MRVSYPPMMFIRNLAAAALLATGPALPAPAVAQASGELATVQRHLRALTTMTADFVQSDRSGKRVTGTLTLKQPGRIRFQYEKGVPLLIVAEGGALTFVDYSVNQVQRWPIRNSPLGVLIDPSRDLSRFARVMPGDAGAGEGVVAVEANDPAHPEYGRITLVFARNAGAPAGLMLQGWVALDSQGNRTSIRLSNQRFGTAVPANSFAWTDPRKSSHR